ncbi:ATP-binding protein [Streptomyces sp. NPDC048825]|uniref:ATP-binding protein n=1 Tax=Streptomyces sp. NPDC048825 TaxID=3365592 RepID=UPI0037217C51
MSGDFALSRTARETHDMQAKPYVPLAGTRRIASGDGASGGAPQPQVAVTSAASARQFVRSVVRERWDVPGRRASEEAVIDLLLVVSELVTNAIRHGGGIAGFDVAPTPDGIRLSVLDYSDVVPAVVHGPGALPPAHVGNGYGWPLIIRLARDIRVERRPEGGKTISVLVPLT